MTDTFDFVKSYCQDIKNDRTLNSVFDWGQGEMHELKLELDKRERGEQLGEDGIIGEAVDVINCMIDLIFKEDPTLTSEGFHKILRLKCDKWKLKYHDPKYEEKI